MRCVYCHNDRSDAIISTEDIRRFLDQNVIKVGTFQMGCIMEPTLDARLADLLMIIANSRANPRRDFVLQTNATLLDRHDAGKIRESGVATLSISIDSADTKLHSALRGGASIAKLERNITNFARNCPNVMLSFITTVTQLNISTMEQLVRLGIGLGARHFTFREVFYDPGNDVVDHSKMPSLMLRPGDFACMAQGLRAVFGDRVNFLFADEDTLGRNTKKILVDSRR